MAEPNDGRRTVRDPRAWVALSHPLRLRIMFELQARDAARAKDLAEALSEPANSVSFHLRQLARFGFIEPDLSPRADAREKWWRTTARHGHRMDGAAMEQTPEGRAASRDVMALMRAKAHRDIDAWFDAAELPAEAWEGPPPAEPTNFEVHLRLTEQESADFRNEVSEVLSKWLDHSREVSKQPDDGERSAYVLLGFGMSESALERGRSSNNE